uniref:Uncharacterized protein n=3 Tax=Arion vulgaris TaxID=1028688 RepID=A0A0B7AKA7_9EUPU
MDMMVKSFFATIVVAVFLHKIYVLAAASKDIHTCEVVVLSDYTSNSGDQESMTILKFDFIRLPTTPDNIKDKERVLPTTTDNTEVNNSSSTNAFTSSNIMNNNQIDNQTNDNQTANQINNTVNAVDTSTNESITIKGEDVKDGTTQVSRKISKRNVEGEGIPACTCQFNNQNTTINILKVWPESNNTSRPLLQVKSGEGMNKKNASEGWSLPVLNTSMVELSMVNNELMTFNVLVVQVKGYFKNLNCTKSMGTNHKGVKDAVLKSNPELLFETPLLVIGAVLAMIGVLLIITGISILRRYRKKKIKAAGCEENMELTLFTQDNYEEISLDEASSHSSTLSNKEIEDTSRKASMSSMSKMKIEKDNKSSSRQQSLEAGDPLTTHSGKRTPSPGTGHQRGINIACRQKIKQRKLSKEKKQVCDNASDDDGENYSSVEQDYEDISREETHSPIARDIRVATPFLLAQNCASKQNPLRPVKKTNDAQARSRSMPKVELPSNNYEYSHLNRTGKSQSDRLTHSEIYNDSIVYSSTDDTDRGQTTDAERNSINIFKFLKLASSKKTVAVGLKSEDDKESNTSSSSNEDDQDHIYEAFEKDEANIIPKERSPQANKHITEEQQSDTEEEEQSDTEEEQQSDAEEKQQTDKIIAHFNTLACKNNNGNEKNNAGMISCDSVTIINVSRIVPDNNETDTRSILSLAGQDTPDHQYINSVKPGSSSDVEVRENNKRRSSSTNQEDISPFNTPKNALRISGINVQKDTTEDTKSHMKIMNSDNSENKNGNKYVNICASDSSDETQGHNTDLQEGDNTDMKDDHKSDTQLLNSVETDSDFLTEDQFDSKTNIDNEHVPEEYVVVDNILYESLPLSEPSKL